MIRNFFKGLAIFALKKEHYYMFKGIVQPFELGGVTMAHSIRSRILYGRQFKKN
jgi:hypothetical protein